VVTPVFTIGVVTPKITRIYALAHGMLHSQDMRILGVLFASVVATGCYATTGGYYTPGYVGPTVAVTATTVEPDLVYAAPGVQVIADFDEPIFYSEGFYWRETGGIWYSSRYHTGGWAYAAPPTAIVSIRDRRSYTHYRPAGYTPRAARYDNRAVVRDNRTYDNRRAPVRDNRVVRDNRQPIVRDNRTQPARTAPAVRDNRTPARAPAVRDNRKDKKR
jgi:hypothetical protein